MSVKGVSVERESVYLSREYPKIVCLSREGVMSVQKASGGPTEFPENACPYLSRDSVGETVNLYACINLLCKSRKSQERVAV